MNFNLNSSELRKDVISTDNTNGAQFLREKSQVCDIHFCDRSGVLKLQ